MFTFFCIVMMLFLHGEILSFNLTHVLTSMLQSGAQINGSNICLQCTSGKKCLAEASLSCW